MATAAQHLTVGGLLNFDFFLASIPTAMQIISVSATLFAHYTLKSIQRPNNPAQYASKKTRLFVFDAMNPPCTDTKMLALNSEGCVTPTMTTGALPSSSSPSSLSSGALEENMGARPSTSRSGSTSTGGSASGSSSKPPSPAIPKDRASCHAAAPIPLQIIEAGGSYHVSHLARLPNDDIIRPSTLEGTKTPIQTRHELILEIRFHQMDKEGVLPGKPMVLRSEHPITLSSCCCMLSSLLVPAYSEALNTPPQQLHRDAKKSWDQCNNSCVCQSSKEDLVAQYRAADDRLRAEHASILRRERGSGMTTVTSWDDLRGHKYEYVPVSQA